MKIKKIVIAAAIGATVFATAACGSDTATTASNTPAAAATTSAMASETGMSSPMESSGGMSSPMESSGGMSSPMESSGGMSSPMESSGGMSSGSNDPAANLVGAGCAAYAEANPSGAGSVGGMATAKLAAAAAGNPLLTTLVAAVSGKLNPKVDLVDTLNSSEFTVFAPVDDAFKKLPAATVDTLKTDDKLLTKILTYHVIAGQLSPDQIVGTHKTLEGGEVTVTGSGDNLKVGDSTVICGGVKTANATVYLIDTVLSPPAA